MFKSKLLIIKICSWPWEFGIDIQICGKTDVDSGWDRNQQWNAYLAMTFISIHNLRLTADILITIKLCNMAGPFPFDPDLDVSTTCSIVHQWFLTTCCITCCNFVSENRYNLGFTSQVNVQSINHCKQIGGNCFITNCNHRSCIFLWVSLN